MAELEEASVDAIVTDPPYGLEFMGKEWDRFAPQTTTAKVQRSGGSAFKADSKFRTGTKGVRSTFKCRACGGWSGAFSEARRKRQRPCECEQPDFDYAGAPPALLAFQGWCGEWATEALRILKPGGHLLAFGGTRTYHRLACAVEDAGFEIRDSLIWIYGSGFPKSLDVSKAIDKAARGVPQGGTDPTSPHHGEYRTTTTEGKRWEGDSGQSYGAGGSRFLATTVTERTTAGSTPTTEETDAAAADGPPQSTQAATAEARQWEGWGTALKPAHEPIVVARKPLSGTVAATVLEHGTGALNVDGCRVEGEPWQAHRATGLGTVKFFTEGDTPEIDKEPHAGGRWPANLALSPEAAEELDRQSGELQSPKPYERGAEGVSSGYTGPLPWPSAEGNYGDTGGASRFFYTAKASRGERNAGLDGFDPAITDDGRDTPIDNPYLRGETTRQNVHPTVKPIDLMRWLVRLVTPPGGTICDPFLGSGTTGIAAHLEGFDFIGIEREDEYADIAEARIAWWSQFPPGTEIDKALGLDSADRKVRESGQGSLLEEIA
jgi:site-specific DNA-methyltransferase (adenine-specific)